MNALASFCAAPISALGSSSTRPSPCKACELAQYGVTVNCISPGQIPKPSLDDFTRENFRQQVPLGRLGVPQDLRGAVVFFASDAGRWITGQNLTIDGGWSAW